MLTLWHSAHNIMTLAGPIVFSRAVPGDSIGGER